MGDRPLPLQLMASTLQLVKKNNHPKNKGYSLETDIDLKKQLPITLLEEPFVMLVPSLNVMLHFYSIIPQSESISGLWRMLSKLVILRITLHGTPAAKEFSGIS